MGWFATYVHVYLWMSTIAHRPGKEREWIYEDTFVLLSTWNRDTHNGAFRLRLLFALFARLLDFFFFVSNARLTLVFYCWRIDGSTSARILCNFRVVTDCRDIVTDYGCWFTGLFEDLRCSASLCDGRFSLYVRIILESVQNQLFRKSWDEYVF